MLAVIALPLRGLFLATGSSMEEGFMLAFPQRVLAGDVPNVDFLHLYGPFSLHVLAGWYWVFGDTLESQRVFGLLQHLGIIFALFALARAWGRRTAVVSAVTVTLLVLTPIGLSALAWEGVVALGGQRTDQLAVLVQDQRVTGPVGDADLLVSRAPEHVLALGRRRLAHGRHLTTPRGRAAAAAPYSSFRNSPSCGRSPAGAVSSSAPNRSWPRSSL